MRRSVANQSGKGMKKGIILLGEYIVSLSFILLQKNFTDFLNNPDPPVFRGIGTGIYFINTNFLIETKDPASKR